MKTLSKKLLSLMLVAVMLVAAIPFAAMADTLEEEKTNVKVVGVLEDNSPITGYETVATLAKGFDTANPEHLANAFLFGNPSVTIDTSKYAIVKGVYAETNDTLNNTLTVTFKKVAPAPVTYTVKVVGDATATGSKQIAAPAADITGDYGAVIAALNNAGLGDYTNAANWEITKIEQDDTAHVVTVTVKKVAPAPEPAKDVVYTVKLTVDGVAQTDKTLTYKDGAVGDLSTWDKVMKEIGMDASKYDMVSFTNVNNVITLSIKTKAPSATTVKITLNDGTKETWQYPEVGKYYSDYAVFYPSAQDGRTPESLKIEENNGSVRVVDVGTKTENGKVRATDVKVTIQWKAADRKINFYTDSTLGKIFKTLTVYSGKAIGELPTEVNGKAVEYWTVWGTRIYPTTTYNWTADAVNAVPHFVGESGKVYLEIYVNGNRTSKYAQRDITHKLQDGVIYRDTLLDVIRDGVKNNSLKLSSVSYLFDESEWSAYVRDSKKTTTNTKVQIGDSEDARYIYVMVNGVTTKTSDSTNPKTGDTAKLGVAAAVLAVAVVGFGAVIVVNKKKGVR